MRLPVRLVDPPLSPRLPSHLPPPLLLHLPRLRVVCYHDGKDVCSHWFESKLDFIYMEKQVPKRDKKTA
jgi:hypothetical protein